MKIRQSHLIKDRLKLLLHLFFLLVVLGNLAEMVNDNEQKTKAATIERLLETALKPVGTTMYVWGGGWNNDDKSASVTSTQIGLFPQWIIFAKQQDETYDYNDHRLERENGLDCSGYVGWVIYNTFEVENGRDGYVVTSTDMAKNYADRGWGAHIENPTEFFAGDIVSMDGHVWISLGTCADGSVLLLHSSPPGVSLCGTLLEDGSESIAVKLATEYMAKYHSEWQKKYPNRTAAHTYLENISLMRWNASTMLDAKELQSLSAEEVLLRFSKPY